MNVDGVTFAGQKIYIEYDLMNFYEKIVLKPSNHAVKKEAGKLALHILSAVKAYSSLLQEFIDNRYGKGHTIRLSPSKANKALSVKFPIALMYNQAIFSWNSFVVVTINLDGGRATLQLACNTVKAQVAGAKVFVFNGLECMVLFQSVKVVDSLFPKDQSTRMW